MYAKITVTKKNLVEGIDRVSRVIDRKSIEPLSNFIFLLIKDGSVFAASSDGKNSARVSLEVEGFEGNGGFGVSYKKLLSVVRPSPQGILEIIYDDDTSWTILKGKGFEVKLPAISGGSFPVEFATYEGGLLVPCEVLLRALDKVRYAAPESGGGIGVEGIKVTLSGGVISAVSLNGFCLSLFEIKAGEFPGSLDFVISKSFSRNLSRVFPRDGAVKIWKKGSEVFFGGDDFIVSTSTYPDNFPDIKTVKEKSSDSILEVELDEFRSFVSMVRAINETLVGMRMSMGSSSDIKISVDREEGKATFTLDGKYAGPDLEIVVDEKGVQELLNNLEVSPVRVEFFGSDKPFMIREEGENYTYLNLMSPLTIGEGG